MTTSTEVRCPNNAGRLFLILRRQGLATPVDGDNLIELTCQDCARQLRQQGQDVFRVLHRYNFLGEWIDTRVVRR